MFFSGLAPCNRPKTRSKRLVCWMLWPAGGNSKFKLQFRDPYGPYYELGELAMPPTHVRSLQPANTWSSDFLPVEYLLKENRRWCKRQLHLRTAGGKGVRNESRELRYEGDRGTVRHCRFTYIVLRIQCEWGPYLEFWGFRLFDRRAWVELAVQSAIAAHR